MNPTDVLAQSQDVARGVLANVTTDQLDLDTPCREWTVSQLVDHLVGGQHWARSGVQGIEVADNGE